MLRRKLRHAFSRSHGVLLIFGLLLLSPSLSFAQQPCPWPGLTGSFLQPALGDTWSGTQWDQEYTYMGNACLDQLVLQWSADSKAHTTVITDKPDGCGIHLHSKYNERRGGTRAHACRFKWRARLYRAADQFRLVHKLRE